MQRQVKIVITDWQVPYNPKTATNRQLADDWRLFIAAIANLEAGKSEPFTEQDLIGWAVACAKEIAARVKSGKMQYQISKSKSESYGKLWREVNKHLSEEERQTLQQPEGDSSDLPAIYLVSPHAELIAAGKKTMVVKARDFSACCDQELLFCSAGLCFGTLKLKKPEKISLEEFEELYPLHRITYEERMQWWPGAEILYAYELYDVVPWDVPRRAELPQGVQTFAKSVKFIDASSSEEPLAPVNPSGVELGEEITLDDVLKPLRSFYRTKPYVSLIGGICNWGKTKGDIDFFIRSNFRDIATEFRIIRMFPKELWQRIMFRYPFEETTHPGVFTNHMDIFDELIERIEQPELVLMAQKKGAIAPLTLEDTRGEDKGKCTKVELFRFCPLLKPMHGHLKGEEYLIEKLIEVVNSQDESWYEKGVYVQKKFDGVHVRTDHAKDGKVVIYSEEGNEITKNLPTLTSEILKACKGHDVVLTGELEFWEDKEHQSRQETTAIIHTKAVHPSEAKVILNAFDCLYYDADIHAEPYSARLKYLEKLHDADHIKKADYRLVHSAAELEKAVEHFAAQPGSEGAYLKRADFPYELDGATRLNLKYKNTFSIDAKVIEIHEVKDANAYNYLCVIEDPEGNDVPIGRTYNTSIKVGVGDILKVEFVNLSQYTDPRTKQEWFNWWAPHVIMARAEKKRPDNTATARKLVIASHGTIAEKPFPARYKKDASTETSADSSISEDGTDPLLTYPDESKHWRGMCHAHIRGRSVHLDLRFQISKDLLVGWTLFIPKGLSKQPANYSEAVQLFNSEIRAIVSETLSNPLKKFNCSPKQPEPIEWASYKGRVEPGSVGATRFEAGDFIILDTFEVQFGAQKSYYHEYFCDGKLFKGRLVFRLLENRKEWKKTDEGLMTWMMFNALKSPLPYVLSTRAVQKQWVPPEGVSAVPRAVRQRIPARYRYWSVKDTSKRRALRDELVGQIKKKVLQLESISAGEFKYLVQTWKGQKVIREGPSRTLYYFVLKRAENYFSLALNSSALNAVAAAGLPFAHGELLWTAEGEVPANSSLNPTKNTPSHIQVLDQGEAIVLGEDIGRFIKLKLKGKKLNGPWVAMQQEGSKMWSFQRSEMPEPKGEN